MRWRVTYRGKDARLTEDVFEAASRNELFKVISAKGISAVRIEEDDGKKRKPHKPKTGKWYNVKVVGLTLTGFAVIAGGILLFVCGKNDTPPKQEKASRPTQIATMTLSKPMTPVAAETKAETVAPEKPQPPPYVKRPGQMQLPDGRILTFPPPRGDEIRKVYAYGHLYECDSEGNFRDITPRKLFHTAFEANFLGLANEDKPFIPAFLTGLDQDEVKKMLTKNYVPIGDETEDEMAQLKAYDDMRCAALQYMEEGGTFDEFVDYFAKQVKLERETNALCLREVMALVKDGKLEEAKEMAQAANQLKVQKGLKPLKLPPHVQAVFDELP